MADKPQGSGADSAPTKFPETPPPPARDMPAYAAQVLFEMSHTLGKIEGALAALTKQVDTVDERTTAMEGHWNVIKGGVAVAVILIPACGGLIWWSLADRIQTVLDALSK